MYLSDFVFFTLTLSILVSLSVISTWDRIGQYTDWQANEHVSIKKKLEKAVAVVEINKTKLQKVSLPTVPVKCSCGKWGVWNDNFIDTPPCCRNQTVDALKSLVKHLNKYKIKYSLSGGTLLGAVRCGEFIQYDYDADMIFFTTKRMLKVTLDKWLKSDIDGIFKRMSITMSTNVKGMETHELKGSPNGDVHFDIGAYEEMDTVPCLFEGMVMQCRSDFKSTLKKTYGSDWMIPHRWKDWANSKLMKDIDNKQLNRCINQRKEMQTFCKVYDNFAIGDKGCTLKNNLRKSKYEYRAQAGQDKYVEQFLNNENGVYVEFGARDGVEHSNTYYFEKTYNWTGILVEPDDRELKKITINRPNAHIYTGVAVCPVGTKEVTFAISSNRGWSGIHNSYDDKRWYNTVISQKTLQCVDLNEICPEHVDYMTVDTEGSEVEILRTFDFTSHDVTIIQVERNMKTEVQRNEEKQLTQFMSKKGYEKIKQIDIGNWAVDCIYKKII